MISWQKEKTRAFINRVRSFRYYIDGPDYDLYAMNAEIEAFCEKHVFPHKVRHNVLLLVEEMLAMIITENQISKTESNEVDIDVSLAYSEKYDHLTLTIEYGEELFNPLEESILMRSAVRLFIISART